MLTTKDFHAQAAHIACILDRAGIPNVLWGNLLLTVYGVPTIVDMVSTKL